MANNKMLSTGELAVRHGLYNAVKNMNPIDKERRAKWLGFRHNFVEEAGTENDYYTDEEVCTDPEVRKRILSIIGDAIESVERSKRCNTRDWAYATECLLYFDPAWKCETILFVPRDTMNCIVTRYILAVA